MTKKEMFKQEILDASKKWDDALQSKKNEDFGSLYDYIRWSTAIYRNKQIEINRIYYFYGRSGYLSEDEMLEIIAKLKVFRYPEYKEVDKI